MINRKQFLQTAAALVGIAAIGSGRSVAGDALRVPAPPHAWDRVEFDYLGVSKNLPGIAVRLPQGLGGGLCAVCRICPHQGCLFGYETDYETVGNLIGKELANPVFFCRCHMSTFDPAQNGALLYGPSGRPLWQFTVQEEGATFIVSSIEPDAGTIG